MPATEERPLWPAAGPPRPPDGHEVVLAGSPLLIRKTIEQEGIRQIYALLLGLESPLSAEQWQFANLRFNLNGNGFHTIEQIREQMGINDFAVHCLLREVHTHLLVLLEHHREDNGQAESPPASQQPTRGHTLATATPH